jgi:hypothetical protein
VGIGTSSPGFKLDVNGDSNVNGTSSAITFLYTSDERLKENVQVLSDALEKVKQLNGVSFNWKSNGQAGIGVIAQNVEKVFPELVSTNPSTGLKSV